ncbi:unnamed protein product [Coccothraustes coccothraustes]
MCAAWELQAEVERGSIAAAVPHQQPASAAPPLPSPARDSSRAQPRAAPVALRIAPLSTAILGVIYSSAFPVFCLSRSPCRAVLAGRDAGELGLGATRLLPGKCRFPQGSRCRRTLCRELRMCLLPPHRSRCFPYEFSTCFLPSFAFCSSSSGSLAFLAPTLWRRVYVKQAIFFSGFL